MSAELSDAAVAMQALVFVAVSHECSDSCPLFRMQLVQTDQLLIFLWRPGLHFALFGVQAFGFEVQGELECVLALDGGCKLSESLIFHSYYRTITK